MESKAGERHNYNATCDEDEFMVAADFTLYSNPINKALYRPVSPAAPDKKSSTSVAQESSGEKKSSVTSQPVAESSAVISFDKDGQPVAAADGDSEWIASDMTMYDSPLAEMERRGFDRDARLTHNESVTAAAAAAAANSVATAASDGTYAN